MMMVKLLRAVHNSMLKKYAFVRRISWALFQQKKEFAFHRGVGGRWRMTDAFLQQTRKMFTSWGYDEGDFDGGYVVDIGAGSKLRSKFFKMAKIVVIDPLAVQYRDLPFSDILQAHKVFAVPAEKCIDEIVGLADLVVCINVLDHVMDPRAVLENCLKYLKLSGELLLSVDCHGGDVSPSHPWGFFEDELLRLIEKVGFEVTSLVRDDGYQHIEDQTITLKLRAKK